MIDVLLILPPIEFDPELYGKPPRQLSHPKLMDFYRITRIPQGLLSIGTYILPYRSLIYDPRFDLWRGKDEWLKKIINYASETRLLVGLSTMSVAVPYTMKIIDAVKAVNKDLPVVLGGCHPSFYPEQCCSDPSVDFVVSGEGEEPMSQLVYALDRGNKDLSQINGLTWKKDGRIITNPPTRPLDMSTVGMPDYSLLENLEGYLTKCCFKTDELMPGIDYNSSRGCPFNCRFCINTTTPQNRIWRAKPADRVVEELKVIKERYGSRFLWIEEDNPFVSMKRNRAIAEGIIREGLDFIYYAPMRVDTLAHSSMDDLKLLRRSGWIEGALGVESGSDRMLKYMNKGFTVADVHEAVRRLARLDIFPWYFLMIYIPYEKYEDRVQTYELMKWIKKVTPKCIMGASLPYDPLPGSSMYQDAKGFGWVEPATFRGWGEVGPGFNSAYAKSRTHFINRPDTLPWVTDYSWRDEWQKFRYRGVRDGTARIFEKLVRKVRWSLQ